MIDHDLLARISETLMRNGGAGPRVAGGGLS
jgi:hypothetical protein